MTKDVRLLGKALETIRLGGPVKFDDQIPGPNQPDYMVRPYSNPLNITWLPMIGVAVRSQDLLSYTSSFAVNAFLEVLVSGLIYVKVRDGLQVYPGQGATVNTKGEFGSDIGELYIGRWRTDGTDGTDLCILELDITELNTYKNKGE